MTDILSEPRISLAEAAEIEGVDVRTIQRWVKVLDDHGRLKRNFLESYMSGGRRYTSREALKRHKVVSQPALIPNVAVNTAHNDAMAYFASVGIR